MQLAALRRVYVRAPNWVGDLVMATAAFARIRESLPAARITCGLRGFLRPLLAGAPWFDEVVEVPKARGLAGLLGQVRQLRAQNFDLAIVLPNSLETGLVPFLARVPWRLGYQQGRPFLMNLGRKAERNRGWLPRHGPRRVPTPMPDYYAELLDQIGLTDMDRRPRLFVTDDERARTAAWLQARGVQPGQRLVLLSAGANYGGSKLWEPDRWAAVARHFLTQGQLVPVLLAGPSDQDLVRRIGQMSGALAAVDPVLPVDSLKALCERAGLIVTVDSGPRHVALAFGVPVVCLLGPNDRRYTDYCLEDQVVIRKDLPCSPCQRKVCPLGHRKCMTEITVAEVLAAAGELLGGVRA